MQSASIPTTENARLKTLQQYHILDTLPEAEYDRITKLASIICGTPIALVSLIDANRQWFKSKVGIDANETPRDLAFCAHAILASDEVLVVNDTLDDVRFFDNPLVTDGPKIRFYAGAPLQVGSGDILGTLCVIDTAPRTLTAQQIEAMSLLADQVVAAIEVRVTSDRLKNSIVESDAMNERNIKALADAMPQIVWTNDPDGSVDYFNQRWVDYTGMTAQQTGGWGWDVVLHPEDVQRCLDCWNEALKTGEKYEIEYRFKRASDGIYRWHLGRALPVRNAAGTIIKWFGTCTDIDDQKRVQEASKETAAQLQLLANALPQLVWIADKGGWINWYNDRWYEYTGTTPKDMEGWGWKSVHDTEKLPEVMEKWQASIATGEPFEMVFPLKSGDGHFRPFLTRVNPIHDQNGKLIQWFGTNTDITHQYEAEARAVQALRYEETERTKLLAMIDNSPDYIGMADLEGNLLYHNRAARLLVGFAEHDDLSHLKISDMHPERINKFMREHAISEIHENGFWKGESALLHRDGHEISVSQTITLYRDALGKPVCFTTIIQDITERKRADDALKNSEELLQLGWRGVGFGIWDWNVATNQVNFSDRSKALLGFNPDEMQDHFDEWASRLHPDDIENTFAALDSHIKNKTPYIVEYRLKHKSGEWRWYHATGQAIWDDAGHATRMVGSLADITERKHAQDALRTANDFNKLILGSIPDFVFVKDAQFRIIEANRAFLEIYPETIRDSIIGTTTVENFTPDDAANFLKFDQQAFDEGMSEAVEVITLPNKGLRHIFTKKVRFENADGEPFILGIARDISELKQAEESSNRLLEKLTQSNTDLERFAYVASHDMQEPLRMIANFSGLIVEEYDAKLDDTGREYIALVRDSSARMQEMIEDLLEYARVKNDEARFVDVNAPLELNHVLMNLSSVITERKAAITHDTLPNFTGNPVQFMRLLQNLIGNSLKYQASNSIPKIHVAVKDEGDHWCFSVTDNGIGINEEFVNQVFEPFKRLHSWDEIKGSGIGLAVCKQIVERHGGKIWATSKVGHGSVFHFTIAKNNKIHLKEKEAA